MIIKSRRSSRLIKSRIESKPNIRRMKPKSKGNMRSTSMIGK